MRIGPNPARSPFLGPPRARDCEASRHFHHVRAFDILRLSAQSIYDYVTNWVSYPRVFFGVFGAVTGGDPRDRIRKDSVPGKERGDA